MGTTKEAFPDMALNTLALAHDFLRRTVLPGAHCIDATAGRGRDTALLCELAGPAGSVLAFDIQASALEQTRALLDSRGLDARLILDSHENMACYAAPQSVDCIVFNFGRLPGGDPQIFTRAASSVRAVRAGLDLLRPGGVMSLSLYYGGPNGYEERDALLDFFRTIDDRQYSVLVCDWANRRNDPPMPVFLWRA